MGGKSEGGWRLAAGGWRLAAGGWWLVAIKKKNSFSTCVFTIFSSLSPPFTQPDSEEEKRKNCKQRASAQKHR